MLSPLRVYAMGEIDGDGIKNQTAGYAYIPMSGQPNRPHEEENRSKDSTPFWHQDRNCDSST